MIWDTKWDVRYLRLAEHVASWSRDPSTKCGAVIVDEGQKRVLSLGYNGFPRGVEDTNERLSDRPTKYKFVAHGELNAIVNAKCDLAGCTIYVWPFLTCNECAKAIIQSGIRRVVFRMDDDPEKAGRWAEAHEVALTMYREAGITVDAINV